MSIILPNGRILKKEKDKRKMSVYYMYYGKSMYGGYYAEFIINDNERITLHAEKLKDLKQKIIEYDSTFTSFKVFARWDN